MIKDKLVLTKFKLGIRDTLLCVYQPSYMDCVKIMEKCCMAKARDHILGYLISPFLDVCTMLIIPRSISQIMQINKRKHHI